MSEQGLLAIVTRSGMRIEALAIASWTGSCGTQASVRFFNVGKERVMLEEDRDPGEDWISQSWDRVWRLMGRRLELKGVIRTAYEERLQPDRSPAWLRSMSATLEATEAGFLVRERWHFTPNTAKRPAFDEQVERRLGVDGDALDSDHVFPSDPMPWTDSPIGTGEPSLLRNPLDTLLRYIGVSLALEHYLTTAESRPPQKSTCLVGWI
jgi:hypothetical protein